MTKALELAETEIEQLMFDAACVYSISAGAVQDDDAIAQAVRVDLNQQYGMHAVELLRKLVDAEYFQTEEQAAALNTNPELESIRGREDFQKIIKDINHSG